MKNDMMKLKQKSFFSAFSIALIILYKNTRIKYFLLSYSKILSLFYPYSFLMLSLSGIKLFLFKNIIKKISTILEIIKKKPGFPGFQIIYSDVLGRLLM